MRLEILAKISLLGTWFSDILRTFVPNILKVIIYFPVSFPLVSLLSRYRGPLQTLGYFLFPFPLFQFWCRYAGKFDVLFRFKPPLVVESVVFLIFCNRWECRGCLSSFRVGRKDGEASELFHDLRLAVLPMFVIVVLATLPIDCSYNCFYTPIFRPDYPDWPSLSGVSLIDKCFVLWWPLCSP